jgi:hypothetical protein
MLFKAQLSTSKLRENLEHEYQLVTSFLTKALHEVSQDFQGHQPVMMLLCWCIRAPLPVLSYINLHHL